MKDRKTILKALQTKAMGPTLGRCTWELEQLAQDWHEDGLPAFGQAGALMMAALAGALHAEVDPEMLLKTIMERYYNGCRDHN